jgi:hypothetical protein
MNDNTVLRIKVPAHLYESVKKQLTITEAKKSGKAFGDWTVVKEKKLPKDGMKKVEEVNQIEEIDKEMEKKTRTLDELKAAKEKLDKKINEMEMGSKDKVEEGQLNEGVQEIISQIFADPANAYDILKSASKMAGHEFDILLSGVSTLAALLGGAAAIEIKNAINKIKGKKAQA